MQNAATAFVQLLQIMNDLREKCPWDKKQTPETLRPLTIEETYELVDAITNGDVKAMKEELGDLLLHIVFYAKIGEERQNFTIESIITDLCQKLIRRHPHIYGNTEVKDEEEVKRNWEKMKLAEGKKSVLEGVPVSLPALAKSVRIQEKARKVGFDWETPEQVWHKVQEELQEFTQALQTGSAEEQTGEFGDVLFALVNYARFVDIDPETALEKTNKKFVYRFKKMEEMARIQGVNLYDLTLEQMDLLWNEAKRTERQ
ncbi:MAG TPA: nucleoside triphosphate pyrophosphohydrolase [Chitinophagales bacterium]|nr:nucleoside triphosphate pyrophosphohydrolase [Chitinophagales bacterium]HRK25817.1 nucleoside triphosphate pyrophosphohydrolase [Chitinophagales bacterium]